MSLGALPCKNTPLPFPYCLQLENEDLPSLPNMPQYEVVVIESQTEIDRKKAGMLLTLSPTKVPPQDIQTPQDVDDESGLEIFVNFS